MSDCSPYSLRKHASSAGLVRLLFRYGINAPLAVRLIRGTPKGSAARYRVISALAHSGRRFGWHDISPTLTRDELPLFRGLRGRDSLSLRTPVSPDGRAVAPGGYLYNEKFRMYRHLTPHPGVADFYARNGNPVTGGPGVVAKYDARSFPGLRDNMQSHGFTRDWNAYPQAFERSIGGDEYAAAMSEFQEGPLTTIRRLRQSRWEPPDSGSALRALVPYHPETLQDMSHAVPTGAYARRTGGRYIDLSPLMRLHDSLSAGSTDSTRVIRLVRALSGGSVSLD